MDFNLGCSGYVYGLAVADGLIQSGVAKNILLLTAETYSKYIDEDDRSLRTIFGDGATATLIDLSRLGLKNVVYPLVVGNLDAQTQQACMLFLRKIICLYNHRELDDVRLIKVEGTAWEGIDC